MVPTLSAFGVDLSDEAADELASHDRVVVFPDTDDAGRRLVDAARLKRLGVAAMREIDATAYDEAGHAVAAFHLGRPISRVTITPDGDVLGSVRHYPIRGKWLQPDVVIDTRTEKFPRGDYHDAARWPLR
jgi:hypothetical protein